MTTATLGVGAAIDSALRHGFSDASVRLMPETRVSDVVKALEVLGITVEMQDGTLVLKQGEMTLHTVLSLRNFAKRTESGKFFVQEGQHPNTWSRERKVEFLRTHSDDEYRALLQSPVLEAGIKTLDPNMSRSEYLGLTRKEKQLFIREYGADTVGRIMRKSK